jgi:molybdopterin synthase sulfur carrier subunit
VAEIVFAKAFRRHVDCPDAMVSGGDVHAALEHYFEQFPSVRGYVLDDLGAVRRHVAVFVDNDLITDRTTLTDSVGEHSTIHFSQALSGG